MRIDNYEINYNFLLSHNLNYFFLFAVQGTCVIIMCRHIYHLCPGLIHALLVSRLYVYIYIILRLRESFRFYLYMCVCLCSSQFFFFFFLLPFRARGHCGFTNKKKLYTKTLTTKSQTHDISTARQTQQRVFIIYKFVYMRICTSAHNDHKYEVRVS
jgi:hypothetical protein